LIIIDCTSSFVSFDFYGRARIVATMTMIATTSMMTTARPGQRRHRRDTADRAQQCPRGACS